MRRALLVAAGGVLSIALGGIAIADVGAPDDSDPRALELLRDASSAARSTSYEGTQIVMLWRADSHLSASVRVSHRAGSGFRIELEPTAATKARTLFEPSALSSAGLSGPSPAAIALVRRNYVVQLDGTDDVLGRTADVVLIRSRAGRPVQRLWIDRSSALTVRRAFYDDHATLVRQTAFVSLHVREQAFAASATAAIPSRSTAGTVDVDGLRAAGWAVPPAPDGMVAYDAVVSGHGAGGVLHLAFTDGIETVSVFEQRGRLAGSSLPGWRREVVAGRSVRVSPGYPRRVMWSSGNRVFTVITECDERVVEQMVQSLPQGNRREGLGARVRRGARRVASWVNPAS